MVNASLILSLVIGVSSIWAIPIMDAPDEDVTQSKRGFGFDLSESLDCVKTIKSVAIRDIEDEVVHLEDLKYLGDGRNGCTYTCKWEGGIEVVVKTPGKPGKEITKSEVKALKAIGEYYGHGWDESQGDDNPQKWYFVAMKKHTGKPITQTKGWKKYVTNRARDDAGLEQCFKFFTTFVHTIEKEVLLHAVKYGVWHQDANYGNVLFNDERTEAQLIDWGTGMSVTANEIRPAYVSSARFNCDSLYRPWIDCGHSDSLTKAYIKSY